MSQIPIPLPTIGPTTQPQASRPISPSDQATLTAGAQTDDLPHGDAFAYLDAVLGSYGLGSLTNWAWQQIVDGASQNEILQRLRDTPEYKSRFAGLIERQKNGLPPMSEADAIAYETQASQLMHAAGMPGGFYDSSDDFQGLIGGNVSIAELTRRVNNGYAQVANTDPLVRQAYTDLFGPSGDAALAATFLDQEKALPALEAQAAAAEFGGASLQFGFPISRQLSIQAGQAGLTAAQARQGFQQLAQSRALFTPTVGEVNAANNGGQAPVTADQGVEAVFGLGPEGAATTADEAMNREKDQRLADLAGGGGVSLGKSGLRGLASSGMENQ